MALLAVFWAHPAPAAMPPGFDPKVLIVKLAPRPDGATMVVTKEHSGRADFDRLVAEMGIPQIRQVFHPHRGPAKAAEVAARLRMGDFVVVNLPYGIDPLAVKARLEQSPDVESVSFDPIVRICGGTLVPNDPDYPIYQYALNNTGTQPPFDPGTPGADCDMEAAWNITTGDSATVLAIVDTGIDFAHPEFTGRIWTNPGEVPDDGIDNDGNGFIDDVHGWDFVNDNNTPQDDHEHGTHVSGIAAANGNNGIGIAGMNWKCKIMPVKVLGSDGSGTATSVAGGIDYAARMGARVISMSLGYLSLTGGNPVESTAVAFAESQGVLVVAAMGNDNVGTPHYPSAYPGVFSVGATDSRDRRAAPFCYSPTSGSNWGPWIDVCAPGNNVWSTLPSFKGSYGDLCGTSMATPHVSGLATLVLALRPSWPPDSVAWIIRKGADDQVGRPSEDTPGFDVYHGWGRINGRKSLQALVYAFPPILTLPGTQNTMEGDTLTFAVTAFDSNFTTPQLSVISTPILHASFTDHGDGTGTFVFMPDFTQEGVYSVTLVASDGTLADTGAVGINVANGCQCPCQGDPQCDGLTNILDVIKTIEVAFRGGAPLMDPDCFPNPGGRTDVNCTGATDVLDVVKVIEVAFRGAAKNFCNPCAP